MRVVFFLISILLHHSQGSVNYKIDIFSQVVMLSTSMMNGGSWGLAIAGELHRDAAVAVVLAHLGIVA